MYKRQVVAYLVETKSNQRFADFLRTNFFEPIGMSSTHLQPDAAKAAGLGDRIVTPYHWFEDDKALKPVRLQQCPEANGNGSIITSVNDYIKYVQKMMNQEEPFSEAIYKALIKPRIVANPDDGPNDLDPFTSPETYDAGWGSRYYRGHSIVWHDGGITGFSSQHFFLPEVKFGAVIFGNPSSAGLMTTILAYELIDEALKVPQSERVDWDAIMAERKKKWEAEEAEEEPERRNKLCPDSDGTSQP